MVSTRGPWLDRTHILGPLMSLEGVYEVCYVCMVDD